MWAGESHPSGALSPRAPRGKPENWLLRDRGADALLRDGDDLLARRHAGLDGVLDLRRQQLALVLQVTADRLRVGLHAGAVATEGPLDAGPALTQLALDLRAGLPDLPLVLRPLVLLFSAIWGLSPRDKVVSTNLVRGKRTRRTHVCKPGRRTGYTNEQMYGRISPLRGRVRCRSCGAARSPDPRSRPASA